MHLTLKQYYHLEVKPEYSTWLFWQEKYVSLSKSKLAKTKIRCTAVKYERYIINRSELHRLFSFEHFKHEMSVAEVEETVYKIYYSKCEFRIHYRRTLSRHFVQSALRMHQAWFKWCGKFKLNLSRLILLGWL